MGKERWKWVSGDVWGKREGCKRGDEVKRDRVWVEEEVVGRREGEYGRRISEGKEEDDAEG